MELQDCISESVSYNPDMKKMQFWTLLTCLTALLDKRHRLVIEYLKEENRILREHIHRKDGGKRILLTDSQRRRLAVKAKSLGSKLLYHPGEVHLRQAGRTVTGW
jgi:hypothetical protein